MLESGLSNPEAAGWEIYAGPNERADERGGTYRAIRLPGKDLRNILGERHRLVTA